jgi:hypothetical protein
MQLHRPRFNNVFVVLTETNQGEDYSEFLMQALADLNVQVLDTRTKQMNSSDDWRNISTNEALRLCTSEWVWFTEQDFVMGMPNEWMKLSEFLSEYDVVTFSLSIVLRSSLEISPTVSASVHLYESFFMRRT